MDQKNSDIDNSDLKINVCEKAGIYTNQSFTSDSQHQLPKCVDFKNFDESLDINLAVRNVSCK